jgi:hypothetical protein
MDGEDKVMNDERKTTRTERARTERQGKTVVMVDIEAGQVLRSLAASLGLFTTRGVEARRTGNLHALILRLADVYERDPAAVKELLGEPPST